MYYLGLLLKFEFKDKFHKEKIKPDLDFGFGIVELPKVNKKFI